MNEPTPSRRDLDRALSRDQGRLRHLFARATASQADAAAREAFAQALQQSIAARALRETTRPLPVFDDSLPVSREAERLIALIRAHQVVVVAGETGSGKTTQLPKLCLAAGRGVAGLIGCTQPRRIAARAVARRVAQELNVELGAAVGYQVRFTETVSERSHIKFMTDGILLAEIQSDRFLSAYDTLIIDEAHERSLNIDFLLGYLKQLLPRRPDLKLIVTSATIDTERFARHFGEAPVLSVEGRGFPVEVRYRPPGENAGSESFSAEDSGKPGRRSGDSDADPISHIVAAVDEITREDRLGDVLVFLPGEREIRDAHQALERRKYRETEVLPLYARLSARDQDRVFNPGPKRRIVLATNVAETSLTVPRIRYVVDPGTARVKRYSPRAKLDRLHIEPISQASADQRKGRCGRVAAGVCYRLYAESDYASRPRYTDPEILRASLANVILRMLALGLGRVEDFPFLEAPEARAISDGWQQLQELAAVDRERRLTPIGRRMARLPVDAKLARILIAAREHGVLREALVIAAFLGIQDPRERPADQRQAADQAHAEFADPRSEFVGVLRLWDAYREAHEALTQSKLRDWCGKRFLAFLRMREWRELHRQLLVLSDALADVGDAPDARAKGAPRVMVDARRPPDRSHGVGERGARAKPVLGDERPATRVEAPTVDYARLHRALIAGLPTQVGFKVDRGLYEGPRGRKYALFPGSPLAKQPPPWVLSATLLDTQRVWGLMNARIEPDWIIAELEHLLARRHFDPHWSRQQGRVIGSEQISLFGLVLAPKRPVHFGNLYPAEAREIFVRQALVSGEINTRAGFLARNLAMLERAREEEAKRRRAGLVADEDWQARWYLDRIPAEINSAVGLDKWWRDLTAPAQQALEWSLAELLPGEGSEADRFPKFLALGDARLALHYRFEPGSDDDGVSLDVPLHLLNALDAARLSWLVPGLVEEKVAAMIRALPKALRRNFVPAPDFARAFAQAWPQGSADTIGGELARFLTRATGAAVSALDFDEAALQPHLRMHLRLLGADRRPIAGSRDLLALRASHGERAERAFAARAGRELAAEGLREFPTLAIPEQVAGEAGVAAYPALVDCGESAALRVFAEAGVARQEHEGGVRRLLRIALQDKARQARRQLPVAPKLALLYAAINEFDSGAAAAPAVAGAARQERLREDLIEAALNAVLADDLATIRDRDAFMRRVAEAGRVLFADAMQRLQLAEEILELIATVRARLQPPLMGWAAANLDDLRDQLAQLAPPGFLRSTPAAMLTQYPRYLQAMALRAERLLRDPARDQARLLQLRPFIDALDAAQRRGELGAPGWRELRWELEELRVSLFAQELGTRGAVSTKRLARQLEALRELRITRPA